MYTVIRQGPNQTPSCALTETRTCLIQCTPWDYTQTVITFCTVTSMLFLWIWTWRLFLSFEGDKTEGSSPSWVDKNLRILNTRCLCVLKLSSWNVEKIYVGLHEAENFQSWKGAFLGGRMVGQSEIVRMQYISKQKSKGSQNSLYSTVQRRMILNGHFFWLAHLF